MIGTRKEAVMQSISWVLNVNGLAQNTANS